MWKQWAGEFIVSTINSKIILCCLWDQLLEVSVHIHGSCKIILNFPLSIVFNSQIFGNFLEMRSLQRLSSDAKVERDSISNNLCLGTLFIYLFMFLDWIWSLQIARKTNLEVVEGVMVRGLLEEFFFLESCCCSMTFGRLSCFAKHPWSFCGSGTVDIFRSPGSTLSPWSTSLRRLSRWSSHCKEPECFWRHLLYCHQDLWRGFLVRRKVIFFERRKANKKENSNHHHHRVDFWPQPWLFFCPFLLCQENLV